MKALKYISFLLFFAMSIQNNNAQQVIHTSQYPLNLYDINPAVAGSYDEFPVCFSFKKFWAGIPQSPSLQTLSGHLKVAENMGAGMRFYNYTFGYSRKSGFEGSYAYHIKFSNPDNVLSFGLSALVYQYKLDKLDMAIENEQDALFQGNETAVVPDFNFGIYYYSPTFHIGFSIPQILNRKVDLKTDNLELRQVRHYFLHTGFDFFIQRGLKLQPSVLLKYSESGIFQGEINVRTVYKDMLYGGLSFRTGDALAIQLGYQYEKFIIGYAYDITVSSLRLKSFGSHEVMLIYTFDNFIR